jgi:hypothetical protein
MENVQYHFTICNKSLVNFPGPPLLGDWSELTWITVPFSLLVNCACTLRCNIADPKPIFPSKLLFYFTVKQLVGGQGACDVSDAGLHLSAEIDSMSRLKGSWGIRKKKQDVLT